MHIGQMQVENSYFIFCFLLLAQVWPYATYYFMTVKAFPEDRMPNFLMDTLMPFTIISQIHIKNYYYFIGE